MTENIIERFLEGEYTPEKVTKLKDCGFITNSNKNSKQIKFIKDEITELVDVSVLSNKKEYLENNDQYDWAYLLISFLDVKLTIHRIQDKLYVKTKDDKENPFRIEGVSVEENQSSLQDFIDVSKDSKNDTFIEIKNRAIKICAPKEAVVPMVNKTALLYVIAQAYLQKLDGDFETLKTLFSKEETFFNKVLNYLGISSSSKKSFKNTLLEIKNDNAKYLISQPIDTARSTSMAMIWEELFKFFNLDNQIREKKDKLNILDDTHNRTKEEKIKSHRNIIWMIVAAIIAGVVVNLITKLISN